jgi:hypothetical protein
VQDLCGVQIIIKTVFIGSHWVGVESEATVGGVISLGGKYFGLTVAHGLLGDLTSPGEVDETEEEGDWLFEYDSIDDENISGVGEFLTQVPSISQNFTIATKELIKTAKIAEKYSADEGKQVKSPPLQLSVTKRQEEENKHTPLESQIRKGKGAEYPTGELLGTIGSTSINDSSLGLDWALIEIDYDRIDSVNEFWVENSAVSDESRPEGLNNSRYRKFKSIRISGIMQSIPPEPSVLAIMGRCPPVKGTISGTIMSMKLPGATDMCEVWNVQLNGVIGKPLTRVLA